MRLKSLFLGLALLASAAADAQSTAADALLDAPADLVSPVSRRSLTELVEYARVGRTGRVERNMLHGPASIAEFTPGHIRLLTDTARTLDLYLLPAAKADTVILVIENLTTTAGSDGRLSVWTRSWQPLAKFWSEPRAAMWLTPRGKKERDLFGRTVPFIVAGYAFDPASGVLTLSNNTEPVMGLEERRSAAGLMLPKLLFRWTPKGFKPIKE